MSRPDAAAAAFTHQLTTTDGQVHRVSGGPPESILAAAEREQVLLPAQCRRGSCGACRATARGDYQLGEHNPAVLPAEEAAQGTVLLCRTFPRGPVEVSLPYDSSRVCYGSVPERTGTITELEWVAQGTARLRLQLGPDEAGGTGLEFEPGQFLELALPGGGDWRAYSLANTPNWDGEAELYVRLRPGGYFSEYLRQARRGDKLPVRGPQGGFGLRETGLRPRWFVAGGTGVAPLLAMLRRMAEWSEPYPAQLFFGVDDAADIFAEAELHQLATALPDFRYQICVRNGGGDATVMAGTPVDALARALATGPGGPVPDVYVCGSPAFVTAVRSLARDHDFPGDRIVVENFAAL